MKNIFFIMLFIIAFSRSASLAQDDMVKLLRSENYLSCGYITNCDEIKDMLIQIRNTQYNKQVFVHHSLSDGSWIDIPAHYERAGNSDYELWHADQYDFGFSRQYGRQFVLKYIVGGQTYWDNNNGANYTLLPPSRGDGPGAMLGSFINVLLKDASLYRAADSNYYLTAYIDLRNIAYAKNVILTYTTNNWLTSTTLNAYYIGQAQTGYESFIRWPNAYNIERWGVSARVDSGAPLMFYITYNVNGTTYYDNNYGSNYVVCLN